MTNNAEMTQASQQITVVVPLLDELNNLPELQLHLGLFQFAQIIFVDGGSTDGSWQWLQDQSLLEHNENQQVTVIRSTSGRAKQLNAGAALATQPHLLFLHADTRLPDNAIEQIGRGLSITAWGRFDVQFIESDGFMKMVAFLMNVRSRWSGIATGDQTLFVHKMVFEQINGFANLPLMEDVDICQRLKRHAQPYCSRAKVLTSARRWLQHGRVKTVWLMWCLRWRYFRGVSPDELARQYHNVR